MAEFGLGTESIDERNGVHLEIGDFPISSKRIACIASLGLDVIAITGSQALEAYELWGQFHRDRGESLIATFARKFGRTDTFHDAIIDILGQMGESDDDELAKDAKNSLSSIVDASKTIKHSADHQNDSEIIDSWGLRSIAIIPTAQDKADQAIQVAIESGDISLWHRLTSFQYAEVFGEDHPGLDILDDDIEALKQEMLDDETQFSPTLYRVAEQLGREVVPIGVSLRIYESTNELKP